VIGQFTILDFKRVLKIVLRRIVVTPTSVSMNDNHKLSCEIVLDVFYS
jgi:hypothetical protein